MDGYHSVYISTLSNFNGQSAKVTCPKSIAITPGFRSWLCGALHRLCLYSCSPRLCFSHLSNLPLILLPPANPQQWRTKLQLWYVVSINAQLVSQFVSRLSITARACARLDVCDFSVVSRSLVLLSLCSCRCSILATKGRICLINYNAGDDAPRAVFP
jgi:hypothetical protein